VGRGGAEGGGQVLHGRGVRRASRRGTAWRGGPGGGAAGRWHRPSGCGPPGRAPWAWVMPRRGGGSAWAGGGGLAWAGGRGEEAC